MSWWTDRRDQFFDGITDTLGISGEHVITVGHSTFPSIPIGDEGSIDEPITVFSAIKGVNNQSIGSQVRSDILHGKSKLARDIYRKSIVKPQFKNILSSYYQDMVLSPLQVYLSNEYADYRYHYTGSEFSLESSDGLMLLDVIGSYDPEYWYIIYEDYNGLDYVSIPITDTNSELGILYHEDRLEDITNSQADRHILNREATYPNIPIKLDGTMLEDAEEGTKENNILRDCRDILGKGMYNNISSQFTNKDNDEDNSMQESLQNSDDILITFGLNIGRDVESINKAIFYTLDRLYYKYRISAVTDLDNKVGVSVIEEQEMSSSNEEISKITTVHQMDIEKGFISTSEDGTFSRVGGKFIRKVGYYNGDGTITYVDKISNLKGVTTEVRETTYDDNNEPVVVISNEPLSDYFIEYSAVYDSHTDIFRLSALVLSRNIHKGDKSHSSNYSMLTMIDPPENGDKGSICLPIFEDIVFNNLKFSDRYKLIDLCIHIVILYYLDTYLRWYETSKFLQLVKIVLYVVSISITVVSMGTGASVSAYILAVAQVIAVSVAIQIMVKWVFANTDNKFLRTIAIIAAVVGGIYAGGGNLSELSMIDTALHVVNAVNMYINVSVDIDMYNLQKEALELKKEYEEYNDYIKELNQAHGFTNSGSSLIVDIKAKYTPIEEPNDFYDRILGINTIDMADAALLSSMDVNNLTRI